jgi:putative spermidine/putrescine transport system substrate-binding protein
MSIWPGPYSQVVRDTVQRDFEHDHGVSLTIEDGGPADNMVRLRANQPNPQYLVVGLDESAVSLARSEGLISRLDPRDIPNLVDVYPEYLLESGFGVGQGVNWVTAWYNSERIKTPPGSYAQFWDPQYRGRIALPSIKLTAGVQWLVVASALASGKSLSEAQFDPEPGFEKWKQLVPNLHSTYETFGAVTPLLAQGEIWMCFGGGRWANHFIMKGAPIERAPVREGAFASLNAMVLVRHPTLEPLGKDLINRLLAPEVQAEFTRVAQIGPVNQRAAVRPDIARLVPFGPDDARSLVSLDWRHVHKHWAAWADRWSNEVAG